MNGRKFDSIVIIVFSVIGVILLSLFVVSRADSAVRHHRITNADMNSDVSQQCAYETGGDSLSTNPVHSYVVTSHLDHGRIGDRVYEFDFTLWNNPKNIDTRAYVYVHGLNTVDYVDCLDPTGMTGDIVIPENPPGL